LRHVSPLVEMPLEHGGSILVEVDDARAGPVTRGGRMDEAVVKAGESLENVLGQIGPAVRGIVAQLRETADWPDEVEVEFAVKLSAGANVIITRTTGEANFRIALRWSRGRA
jgi:Trypsin-co-occurring domain 1